MHQSNLILRCGTRTLDLSEPALMGVLNITPDSFSDGGRWIRNGTPALDSLLTEATAMVDAGAQILDVGGESTRPGAAAVSLQEEMDRVLPVVEALANSCDAVVSVDSSSPELMRAAADLGAGMLNDVRALQREGALEAASELGLPVCLMHMQGSPVTMQEAPAYDNAVADVMGFLQMRANACEAAGISSQKILLDPGFGFGKTLEHNLALVRGLKQLAALGYPLLVGVSRKSMVGAITGKPVAERLAGSLALALITLQRGASILRVHDVVETADMMRVYQAVREAEAL
ncbi:MAG: dihydropteroate synthase [Pseudomonadota bacterium]